MSCLLAVVAVAASDALASGPPPADPVQGFREFVEKARADWKVPGLAVAVVKDGEVVLQEGFGSRDASSGLPVTPTTLFAIGSATKAFTTLLLATLVDEGKLDWDAPVTGYLPTFRVRDEAATRLMTVRDLVTHRSGLPRHDSMWYGAPFGRKEMVDRLRYLEPSAGFRERFQYQNLMYMTAGYLAEQVAGASWEELVRSRILGPLGMTSSNFSVKASASASDVARPYRLDREGRPKEIPFRDVSALGPAGSINSTAAEMTAWVRLQLGGGEIDGRRIVSRSSMAEIQKPQVVADSRFPFDEMPYAMYALGWFVEPYRGHAMIHHGGSIDGFSALVSFLPKDGIGLVVLTNLDDTPLPTVVALTAYDRLLGLDPIDWNARLLARWEALERITGQAKAAKAGERKEGTHTSHGISAYPGEYEHPAYGRLAVERDGERLSMSLHGLRSTLEHWHYDVFRVEEKPLDGTLLHFLTNLKGDVDRVAAILEPSAPEVVFSRRPPEIMFDPSFLSNFAGRYEMMGQTIVVDLRGSLLTASVPGQPVYELAPYRGTEFDYAKLAGHSVRFLLREGKVTGALFLQPEGVYEAVRK